MKKKIDKKSIIVISVSVIAAVLLLIFLFQEPSNDTVDVNSSEVVLNENGEPSYLNLSVPQVNKKEDSLSLLDNLEKIKQDSVNSRKINTSGLEEYDNFSKHRNQNDDANSYVHSKKIKGNKKVVTYSRGNSGYDNRSYTNYNTDYDAAPSYSKSNYQENISEETTIEPVQTKTTVESNNGSGFFRKGKKQTENQNNSKNQLIYACIHGDQTIMQNNRVKMRLIKETIVNGLRFPANTIVYGNATIEPNRLIIKINKINQTEVKLNVFDAEDSNKGLYVMTPNLNAFIKKELKNDALEKNSDFDRIPLGSTLKSLLTKKVKEEKIEILNNYKLIIKETKENETF
jgi:hypothetical protein